jgi:predicted TIM-barrel fold metal-dependent hydrolase
MIVDGSVTFGADPTGQSDCSIETLRRVLDRHGIDRACVYSQLAVRTDTRQGNDEVLALAATDQRFRPVAVIDPRHIDSGAREVERCVAAGVRLFRLFPDRHGYPWRYEPLTEVWESLQRSGVVLIAPEHGPGGLTEFLTVTQGYRFPKILIGCRYTVFTEYLAAARRYPDTYWMAVAVNYPGAFETLAKEIGSRRVCFGTNAPVYYVGASLMVVQHCGLTGHERADILSGTLMRLLGEKT